MVDCGPDVRLKARRCVLRELLKEADAIHVAAAVAGECDVLTTLDGRLQKRYGETRFVDNAWMDEVYPPWPERGVLPGLFPKTVYLESFEGARYFEVPETVASFQNSFDESVKKAVPMKDFELS